MKFLSLLKRCIPSMFTIDTDNLEQIPAQGPALLVGDHPNILDGVVLAVASPRPVRILVAAELCTSPLVRRFIDNLGWIPVERHSRGKNGDVLKECVRALEEGEVVAIFPEGKTNYGKELLPFQPGAALLAQRSGAPVVSFSVRGTEKLYPDGSRVFRSGRVGLRFGEPRCYGPEHTVEETLAEMRERIAVLRRELGPEMSTPASAGKRLLTMEVTDLLAAALAKTLSLSLLTVSWKR